MPAVAAVPAHFKVCGTILECLRLDCGNDPESRRALIVGCYVAALGNLQLVIDPNHTELCSNVHDCYPRSLPGLQ